MPVVLIIGTSMDAGKTVSAVAIVRELTGDGDARRRGEADRRRPLPRHPRDAASRRLLHPDFVEAGLPSTVAPADEYEAALLHIRSCLAAQEPDVVVAEAGASPLEPYNGDVAVRLLAENVRMTVLCASDPYAVVGVITAFNKEPDLIAGRATSTSAGVALVEKLASIPALNLLDPASGPDLAALLRRHLG